MRRRLIDANGLKRRAQKVATQSWKMKITARVDTVLNQFIDWINEAPTIEPQQQWTLCSERLPKTPVRVQIQLDNSWIITGYYDDGYWYSVPDCGDALNGDVIQMRVVAWRELPMPYMRGVQDE